jgi:hypothetical protein
LIRARSASEPGKVVIRQTVLTKIDPEIVHLDVFGPYLPNEHFPDGDLDVTRAQIDGEDSGLGPQADVFKNYAIESPEFCRTDAYDGSFVPVLKGLDLMVQHAFQNEIAQCQGCYKQDEYRAQQCQRADLPRSSCLEPGYVVSKMFQPVDQIQNRSTSSPEKGTEILSYSVGYVHARMSP